LYIDIVEGGRKENEKENSRYFNSNAVDSNDFEHTISNRFGS
jgi:hypothetical protein